MKKLLRKRSMLLVALLVGLCMPMMAERSYTFNVAAYNVDGLPQELLNVQINEGGMEAEGARQMAEALKQESWEIVGIAEDFNYHDELTSGLSDYYTFGSHSGKVVSLDMLTSSPNGLGFMLAKKGTYPRFSNEATVQFEQSHGTIADGDIFIRKAFRYYMVELAEGVAIDVYVLHMDAGSDAQGRDVAAREAQLMQLRDYIAGHNNGRHIFILGDTNCRYTRERLQELFIEGLHTKDNTLTVRDAWVEMMWGGSYPDYGSDAMMVDKYGAQRGEVVDKILYIENSKSPFTLTLNRYEHDMTFPVTDHYPVVANFTLTVPEGEQVTDWSYADIEDVGTMTLDGDAVANNGVYYLRNVSSGLYMKAGAAWGTQACEGHAGMPITFIANNEGKYKLQTVASVIDTEGTERSLGHDGFMDNTGGNYWTVEPVEGTQYQYYIYCDGGAVTSFDEVNDNANKAVRINALDKSSDKQKWILLSDSRMKSEMKELANAATPFDATPLIQAADFDKGGVGTTVPGEGGWGYYWPQYKRWSGYENIWNNYCGGHDPYSAFAYIYGVAKATTISQTLTSMPAGKYVLKYQAFYNYEKVETNYAAGQAFNSSKEQLDLSTTIVFGGVSKQIERNAQIPLGNYSDASNTFKNSLYGGAIEKQLDTNGSLKVEIYKPQTTEGESGRLILGAGTKTKHTSWVCLDNLQLYYYGAETSEEQVKASVLNEIKVYLNEAWEEVKNMDPDRRGDIAEDVFDVSILVYRIEQGLVSSDGSAEKAIIDAAVEISRWAHKKAIIDDAIEGDVTGLIINPSFEEGMTGWSIPIATGGVNVKLNSDPAMGVSNAHSNHILDAYHSDDATSVPTTSQKITGLKNGLYQLTALITSFGKNEGNVTEGGNKIFLKGNSYHKGYVATTKSTFHERTLLFLVEDGTATIGVVGGYNGFYYPTGCFYRADNFRLRYITDVHNGRVKLALDELREATIDEYGDANLDLETGYGLSTVNTVENVPTGFTASTAKTEVNKLRDLAITAGKAQGKRYNDATDPSDMTWAITNPNFETGDYKGWNTTAGWETIVGMQDDRLSAVGADGRYLFNTWNDDTNAKNSGINAPIYQTITGIKNGKYRLSAMVASNNGNTIFLAAKGGEKTDNKSEYTTASVTAIAGDYMSEVTISEFEVSDGKATIMVAGADATNAFNPTNGGCWYKADNFRLQYIGHTVELKQDKTIGDLNDWYTDVYLTRPVKSGVWNSFVVPFDMKKPLTWDVRALTGIEIDGDHLSLKFSRIATNDEGEYVMAANTPYMVRYYPQITSGDVHDVLDRNVNVNADDDTSNDDPQEAQSFTSEGKGEGVIYTEYVTVNAKGKNSASFKGTTATDSRNNGTLDFMGSYLKEYTIPSGSVFIQDNKFYISQNANKIRGYRAYFTPNGAAAQARTFGMRSGEDTGIETEDNTDVTVVGIYNLNGMPLTEMQSGVNILKMSDGSIMKVIME